MEKKNLWKRLLGVILSVCMVVGLITVSEPNKAEASDGTNILANGDFASADSAWVDQNGTPVPAQDEVNKVTITEYLVNGDFEDTATNRWLKGTITPGAGYNGTAGLVYTPSSEGAETYYVVNGLDTTGEITYKVKMRIKTVGASGNIVSYFSTDNNGGWNNVKSLSANTDWTEYTTTFTTTQGIYRIGIESTATSGTIYIDDVSVATESVEMDITTTDVAVNGDFENATIKNWNKGTITAGAGYNGTAGLVYTPSSDGTTTYYELSGLDTTGTVTYTMKIRVKTDGAGGQLVSYYSTDKDGGWNMVANISATTDWTEYTTTFTTTQGKYRIGMESGAASGTISIDDLRITYETQAVDETDVAVNGGFENATIKNWNKGTITAGAGYNGTAGLVYIPSSEGTTTYYELSGLDTTGTVTYTMKIRVKTDGAGGQLVSYYSTDKDGGWNMLANIAANTDWTEYTTTFTTDQGKYRIGMESGAASGTISIDDLRITYETPAMKKTYTEGIGTCNNAETDNVLVMKDYTKVTQPVTITSGETYSYSIAVKGVDIGSDFAASVIAGDTTVQTITVTSEWTTVEGKFTATANATDFGFARTGEGELWIDDVSLVTDEQSPSVKPSPSDHTVQGGAYIPEGQTAVFSQDMSSSSNLNLTSLPTATVDDGMLKLPFTGSGYVQTNQITVQANTAYTLSFYAWVDGAADGFKFNLFASGAGIGWKDYAATSITEDTDGWQLVTYQFTATSDSTIYFGFMNYGSGAGTVYVDDLALSTEAVGEATDITLTYGQGSNFHYEQENRLYIQSTGTKEADLTGTLEINGTEVSMTYEHHEGSLVLLFGGKLSETDVNTVVIPAGTTLYNGSTAVYNIVNTFTIYTKKVADGQWMSWLSEYDYQGSDVMYYDMGTAGTKYVFNNVADITYQGVLIVTGKADIMLGGKTNASQEVTALGDYKVSRTIKGEKYDYTVALYKRGDADKTQDGELTVQDLVAAKKAVNAVDSEFGYARYKAADSNTDGTVNEDDAAFMRYILVNDEYDITTTTSKGYSTLGQGVMPIIGYSGPSDHAASTNTDLKRRSELGYQDDFLTDSIFALVKDLGFNVFTNQVNEVGNDYETSTKMLKLAEKYNLGVFINNAYVSNQSYVQENLPIQTGKYDSFSSFHGYYVADEPTKDDIGNYTTSLTAMKDYVHLASYFNMLPRSDSDFTFGGDDSYMSYMNKAAETDAEALSYDLYLRGQYNWSVQEIRTKEFYKNLDVARTSSSNKSKPFYAFVQTGTQFESTDSNSVVAQDKMVTVQEMYLEANAALAMGAKGINYFTLVQGTTDVSYEAGDLYSSGLITLEGRANHGNDGSAGDGKNYNYYDAAKKINTFIAAVDEVLMNATSNGVVTTNSTVKGYIGDAAINATDEAAGVLKEITGSTEAFVGCFDYYGKDAYLIVNITPDAGNNGNSENITLNFDGTCSYTATDMACTEKTASGQSASFTVGAGEAVLVVVE